MELTLTALTERFGITPEILVLAGIGIGAALLFFAVAATMTQRSAAAVRIAQLGNSKIDQRRDKGLLKDAIQTPKGLMKAILPSSERERLDIEEKFLQAGLHSPNALRNYTLWRIVLGFGIPFVVASLIMLTKMTTTPLPQPIVDIFQPMEQQAVIRLLAVLVFIGYFAPRYWLSRRVAERKRRITESFPNGLDLLHVAVEAGMGFDAAMTRVGNEMAPVAPELAFEFLSTQHQIQAGRNRDEALADMARRTGVDMVHAFATVIQQSVRFGTSMSDALETYAKEMRLYRELKAQELANKLPVKMSGVLAMLMLPAMVLVTLGPVVIRYINYFGS